MCLCVCVGGGNSKHSPVFVVWRSKYSPTHCCQQAVAILAEVLLSLLHQSTHTIAQWNQIINVKRKQKLSTCGDLLSLLYYVTHTQHTPTHTHTHTHTIHNTHAQLHLGGNKVFLNKQDVRCSCVCTCGGSGRHLLLTKSSRFPLPSRKTNTYNTA